MKLLMQMYGIVWSKKRCNAYVVYTYRFNIYWKQCNNLCYFHLPDISLTPLAFATLRGQRGIQRALYIQGPFTFEITNPVVFINYFFNVQKLETSHVKILHFQTVFHSKFVLPFFCSTFALFDSPLLVQ